MDGKISEGTGLGDGDTRGAKDVSDELEDQDQLLGAQQKGEEKQEEKQDEMGPQQDDTKGERALACKGCRRAAWAWALPGIYQPARGDCGAGVEMDDDFDGALEDVQPNAASDDDGEHLM